MNLKQGVWGLKTGFGPIGPKDLPSHKARTLLPIFTNKASLYQESRGESNNLLKYYNES